MTETNSFCIVAEEKNYTATNVTKRKRIERLQAPTTLNKEQKYLFDKVADTHNFSPIFVTGSAGTGKSALLMALRNYWRNQGKTVFVAAYTHLASRNIDGKTCHSLFGFDFKLNLIDKKNIGIPDYIILDEISMIPDKMLDGIDSRMRQVTREPQKPFGGVNTIVFGDLYQLPPIEDKRDMTLPPYSADIWSVFKLYELKHNMRQTEAEYIKNLNLMRSGEISCLKFFNTLVTKFSIGIEDLLLHTSLVSTHREADDINMQCYIYNSEEKEETILKSTSSLVSWNFYLNVFNTEQEKLIFRDSLKVCKGTRVMITHTTGDFCNGDLGIIDNITDKGVMITREHDNKNLFLSPICLNFYSNIKNTVKQVTGLPLTYGWAITIHKAQGMTIKNLIVFPKCLFAPGQAYVALSRCIHSNGLKLADPVPVRSVQKMNNITNVYKNMELFI
uniref:Helicase-2 n=1 Tax=Cryptophlebia leucotreta granulosis virus TaxID=35254 RepID=A0A2H4ZK82_GVCL|nr:helicase-2 [Cryptophlebia leucotreta granulovirus]